MKCIKCNNEINPGDRFCRMCGCPVSRRCPECGSEVGQSDLYCGKCGARLHNSSTMNFEAAGSKPSKPELPRVKASKNSGQKTEYFINRTQSTEREYGPKESICAYDGALYISLDGSVYKYNPVSDTIDKIIEFSSENGRYFDIFVNEFGIFCFRSGEDFFKIALYSHEGNQINRLDYRENSTKSGKYKFIRSYIFGEKVYIGYRFGHGKDKIVEVNLRNLTQRSLFESNQLFLNGDIFANDKYLVFDVGIYKIIRDVEYEDFGLVAIDLNNPDAEPFSLEDPYGTPFDVLDSSKRKRYRSERYYDECSSYRKVVRAVDMKEGIYWVEESAEKDGGNYIWKWVPYIIAPGSSRISRKYDVRYFGPNTLGYHDHSFRNRTRSRREYFDGKIHLCAPHYSELISVEANGNEIIWDEAHLDGHGNCDSFQVYGEYVIVDLHALDTILYKISGSKVTPIRKFQPIIERIKAEY